MNRKNGSKPSHQEMQLMESTTEQVESLQKKITTQLCQGWLLSQENTDARRAEYCKGSRSRHAKHQRSPTVLLSEELFKFNAENKENVSPKVEALVFPTNQSN